MVYGSSGGVFVYFLIGTIVGLVVGISNQFQYTSAHAHINLVGWASLALIGSIYCSFPKAGETQLAKVQFWLHNIGLPLLIISFVLFPLGFEQIGIPFASVGGSLVIVSVILFLINVFKHISALPTARDRVSSETVAAGNSTSSGM